MSPKLAAFFTIFLILYLFWIDRKNNEGFSKAIWIPFIWLFFSRSRNISEWLNLQTPDISAGSAAALEGNPLNTTVYGILLFAGILILLKKKVDWHTLFIKNGWIWLYFAFGALSFAWSDYPYVSFKRWIKALSLVVMVVIILMESRPYIAIGVLLKRLAFILLPLSVLFIKYYPELGRTYHMGTPMFTGIASQKNGLGALCLISGIYFSWNLLYGHGNKNEPSQSLHYSIYLIMIPMIAWLFYMADSSTSLACMVFALGLFVIAKHPVFKQTPHKIMYFLVAGVVLFGMLELAFGIKDTLFVLLDRRPDLTNRTYLWEEYLSLVRDPIIGYGYEIFYSTALKQNMLQDFHPAHNGYLEMYLNLGIIGIIFVLGWISTGLIKIWQYLVIDYAAAILRLAFIGVTILYSWTEVTFSGTNIFWMLLFVAVMSMPGRGGSAANEM